MVIGRTSAVAILIACAGLGLAQAAAPAQPRSLVPVDEAATQKPSVDAPVLTAVSFAILGRPGSARDTGWAEVQLTDGRRGFIAAQYARSSIDHRAFFTRTAGRWLMTLFVAGD